MMKNTHNFLILGTILFSFMMIGCEQKTELLKDTPNDSESITNRWVDDCDDCPNVDDCCCKITWVSGDPMDFETCGTTDGDAATCTGSILGCSTIDGKKNSESTISSLLTTRVFCMVEGQSFTIKRTNAGTTTVNITCQNGQVSPQSINVVISGAGTTAFSVDDDCEISQCP